MVKTTFSGTISQIQEASVDGRDVVGLAIATNAESILQFVWHSSVQATPIPSGTTISIEYVPVAFHIPESQKRIELVRSEQVVRRCKATVTSHEQIRTGLPGAADIGLDRDIVTIEFRTSRETCLFDRIPGYALQTGYVVELDLALTGISIPEQQRASKWEEKVQKTARQIHTQDTQSASEPKAYAASNRRFIRGVAASQALQDEWMPHRKRNEIADGFKKEFFNLCERARLVQEHGMVSSFKFIQGSDLIKCRRFPHYNEVKHLLKRFDEIKSAKNFISHRWFCPTHPDPDGRQLALLRPCLEANAFYWIDFTCLPQKSRTQEEEAVFRDSIRWLPSLMFDMSFIVLRFEGDGYVERAWCFFELLAANCVKPPNTLCNRTNDGAWYRQD